MAAAELRQLMTEAHDVKFDEGECEAEPEGCNIDEEEADDGDQPENDGKKAGASRAWWLMEAVDGKDVGDWWKRSKKAVLGKLCGYDDVGSGEVAVAVSDSGETKAEFLSMGSV